VHKTPVAISLWFCSLACGSSAIARGPFPRLLPPPEDFRLTLREGPRSDIPLGPSCGGEASLTLLCRAFTLTLENASKHTVHISELRCFEPDVVFEIRQSNSSSGWWPISQQGKPTCKTLDWVNIRLKPGEKTEYNPAHLPTPIDLCCERWVVHLACPVGVVWVYRSARRDGLPKSPPGHTWGQHLGGRRSSGTRNRSLQRGYSCVSAAI